MNAKKPFVAAIALCFSPLSGQTQLQPIPLAGPATKLSSVVYWEPPNDQKVKLRLTGDKMLPLPDTLFNVQQLTVEMFSVAGRLEAVVEAPECTYAPLDGIANSPGHLRLKLNGDRIHVEGDGFLWRQSDNSLAISNNVYTVIKTGSWSLSAP